MSVLRASRSVRLGWNGTMALRWREGNQRKGLFPRLLLGLSAKMNLDGDTPENQLLSSDLIFLLNSSNGRADHNHVVTNEKGRGFPDLSRLFRNVTVRLHLVEKSAGYADQLPFNSGLIFFSNSSIEVSPLIRSPLMKKVGVESTFKTSLAYFWSAAILSSRD